MSTWEHKVMQELTFKAVRSSGSGGQHVNKTSTKVELTFDLNASAAFNDEQKLLLLKKLKKRISKDGLLILQSDESRSQHKNKTIVTRRFMALVQSALEKPKKRISTKVPKSAITKRLKNKQKQSDKKEFRKPPELP
ncbi:alternative ribosome rescue aminoacyl-tRNA hydrolase ArfB [Aestuariivivens sediminicola]|uniref:alternative ribosome rescue aminoacyl-tRNA hydrolase ArfB n=1 Tax=Aestuariivivens sediminicola TaxID=2913560 RepID=UPI001F5619D5|nr:alternative ribosome rescue aminoacyl-tRNA hydrolase ArfB [Aestuariivivens sediminicola]